MQTLELNDLGISFIEKTNRKIKNQYFIFPVLCVFILFAGYVKLGLSLNSIIVTVFLCPVLFLYFYKSCLEPRKLINSMVTKIDLGNQKIFYHGGSKIYSGVFIRNSSRTIYIHESTLRNIYIVKIGADELLIIPDFFTEIDKLDTFRVKL